LSSQAPQPSHHRIEVTPDWLQEQLRQQYPRAIYIGKTSAKVGTGVPEAIREIVGYCMRSDRTLLARTVMLLLDLLAPAQQGRRNLPSDLWMMVRFALCVF